MRPSTSTPGPVAMPPVPMLREQGTRRFSQSPGRASRLPIRRGTFRGRDVPRAAEPIEPTLAASPFAPPLPTSRRRIQPLRRPTGSRHPVSHAPGRLARNSSPSLGVASVRPPHLEPMPPGRRCMQKARARRYGTTDRHAHHRTCHPVQIVRHGRSHGLPQTGDGRCTRRTASGGRRCAMRPRSAPETRPVGVWTPLCQDRRGARGHAGRQARAPRRLSADVRDRRRLDGGPVVKGEPARAVRADHALDPRLHPGRRRDGRARRVLCRHGDGERAIAEDG